VALPTIAYFRAISREIIISSSTGNIWSIEIESFSQKDNQKHVISSFNLLTLWMYLLYIIRRFLVEKQVILLSWS